MLARYLDLGARACWMAERALAFELDRDIRIMRFDYFPEKLQGVTGADLLEADLAELEAVRIEDIKSTVPVKHTFSLLRDFPLQFGQLKLTGRCTFRTEELPMRIAYPSAARIVQNIVRTSGSSSTIRSAAMLLHRLASSRVEIYYRPAMAETTRDAAMP